MQIRKDPRPLGMTGLSNGLDTPLDTPRPRARAPVGGEPRRRPIRKPLTFLWPNFKHLTFFRQKSDHQDQPPLTPIGRRLP